MSQREAAKGKAPTAATVEASSANNQCQKEIAMPDSIVSVREDQIQAIVGELVSEDGRIYTTSMQVAEHFGKAHRSVLLAIRRMECSRKFIEHNFVLNEYTDSIGRKLPAYRITRDGFVFLAMGFTGKEAAAWKEAYITAFNQMEARLLAQATPALPAATLTPAQQQQLKAAIEAKCKGDGRAYSQCYRALYEAFHIPSYKDIPASQFEAALSFVASWQYQPGPIVPVGQYETLNELLARLARQLAEPNGYSVITFMPLYEEICRQLGHSPRYVERLPELLTDPGFEVSDELLSQLQLAVHQRLMQKLRDAREGVDVLETAIRRIKGKPAMRALPA